MVTRASGYTRWIGALGVCLAFGWADRAMAADPVNDPAAWAERVRGGSPDQALSAIYPRKVLMVGDFGPRGEPTVIEIDVGDLVENSFVRGASSEAIQWAYRLNPDRKTGRGGDKDAGKLETRRVLELIRLTGADIVVKCGKKADSCALYGSRGDSVRRVKVPSPKEPGSGPALRSWLREVFGYDGVVVARDGKYALVGAFKPFGQDQQQALALRGSESRFIIGASARQGMAVLQLVRRAGPWGVFEVVLGDSKAEHQGVPIGAKLIIEADAPR